MLIQMDEINDRSVGTTLQLKQIADMERTMYGNVSFFNDKNLKHTVFDKESIEEEAKNLMFGETCVFTPSIDTCDMISDLGLKVILPSITQFDSKWTNTIGHSIVDFVSVVYQDTEIVRYTGEYLHVSFLLQTSSPKRQAVCEMIQHKQTETALSGLPHILRIGLPFFKSEFERQMFPMLLMEKDAFQIKVKFKPISKCLFIPRNSAPTCKLVPQSDETVRVFFVHENEQVLTHRADLKIRCQLTYDGYHLTESEKLLFKSKSGDILFRTVEYRTVEWQMGQRKKNIDIDFNGMVSELTCMVRDRNSAITNRYFSFMKLSELDLIFQGRSNFETNNPMKNYWNATNRCTPTTWVYSIPFCLSSIQTQPSGQRRFDGKSSRSSIAIVKSSECETNSDIIVFARMYTILSFDNGRVRFHKI